MTSSAKSRAKRILWRIALVAVGTFAVWRACGPWGRTGTIWMCDEAHGKCSCSGSVKPKDRPGETLCDSQYECCWDERRADDASNQFQCNCWNPSKGGPPCKPLYQRQFGWMQTRVERCQ
jgi:hypothetical protein